MWLWSTSKRNTNENHNTKGTSSSDASGRLHLCSLWLLAAFSEDMEQGGLKMATEKRLIDANKIKPIDFPSYEMDGLDVVRYLSTLPTVNAVEIPDKEMLRAVKLLLNQYEHSKNSDYVHSPVAHAFYHTWKQLDERRE